MKKSLRDRPMAAAWGAVLLALLIAAPSHAHDPIFGIGPHVLYKGGVEVATEVHRQETGGERENELSLELAYGITGDWAVGVRLPYAWKEEGAEEADGPGDVGVFTKYRFWRHDSLGVQESAAVLLRAEAGTGDEKTTPALGTGSTDAILGLAYGYESLTWYRWASIRYRRNGENDAGLKRGDRLLLDLVGGWRPTLPSYYAADTVWLLEVNGEHGRRATLDGAEQPDTGGTEWFLSPGIFWTKRNFAIKAGVQFPIASDLNGDREETDYRARAVFEWHL